MAFQFYFGTSGSGKSTALHKYIIDEAGKHPEKNYLIIVPDQFTMQTQVDMIREHPLHGIMNIDVLSFGRLSHHILEAVGANHIPVLDDTGKSLILQKLAGEMMDQLPVLGPNLHKLGFVHEVKSAISEFEQYGIGPEELAKRLSDLSGRGALYYKLEEISRLYTAFREALRDRFVTKEEALELVAERMKDSELVRGSIIAFDGFTGFTPIQYRVIQELMIYAEDVIFTILLDPDDSPYRMDGEQKLFHLSKDTVRKLQKCAEAVGVSEKDARVIEAGENGRFAERPELAHLEKSLFRYPLVPYEKEVSGIHLSCDSTVREEIRQTCLRIRKLIREDGYRYHDIAVVTGDLSAYADDVEELFAAYGIPAFLDSTSGILQNPFTEYIRSALDVLIKDYSEDAVRMYLRSGLTNLTAEETDLLENFIHSRGVRGKRRWNGTFQPTKKEQKAAQKKGEEETLALEGRYELLNELRCRTIDGLSLLCTKTAPLKDHIRGLYEFMRAGQVEDRLNELADRFELQNDLQKAGEYRKIYGKVLELLDQIYALVGDDISDVRSFEALMEAGFAEIKVGSIPAQNDRVLIGDMERTRLWQVKALFFLGINDGNIPGATGHGGILSDMDREFLQGCEWELAPTPRQQMFIQRLYLYMNMTKPSEHLFLSYAGSDVKGKSLTPSYLIKTVQTIFPHLVTEFPERSAAEEQLDSITDIHQSYAALLRDYVAGVLPKEREYELKGIHQIYGPDRSIIMEMAFGEYRNTPLAREIARQLYGAVLEGSVSRLELFASCAYAHFLEYGIGLEEKEEHEFDAGDMGNLFHSVLEQVALEMEERHLDWNKMTREEGLEILHRVLEAQVSDGYEILTETARGKNQYDRIRRILERTLFSLQHQVQKGSFTPGRFEVAFSTVHDLEQVDVGLSEKEKLRLSGRIDRLDLCREEDTLYVKIIDYKSGEHRFDLAAVYYGQSLQLVTYLNAALEFEKKRNPGMKVLPAAMLYYRIQDPIVKEEEPQSEEEINQQIRIQLKMTGLVSADVHVAKLLDRDVARSSEIIPVGIKDGDEFTGTSAVMGTDGISLVSKYVNRTILRLGRKILDGEIGAVPLEKGGERTCRFCSFRGICGYDERIPGYHSEIMKDLPDGEILNRMKSEEA